MRTQLKSRIWPLRLCSKAIAQSRYFLGRANSVWKQVVFNQPALKQSKMVSLQFKSLALWTAQRCNKNDSISSRDSWRRTLRSLTGIRRRSWMCTRTLSTLALWGTWRCRGGLSSPLPLFCACSHCFVPAPECRPVGHVESSYVRYGRHVVQTVGKRVVAVQFSLVWRKNCRTSWPTCRFRPVCCLSGHARWIRS